MACFRCCATYNKCIKASSIEFNILDETIDITIPDTVIADGSFVCVDISAGLPNYTGNPKITVTVNGNNSNIINSTAICDFGTPNYLYANQLKRDTGCSVLYKRYLKLKYAADSSLWGYVGKNTVDNTSV